VLRGHCDAVGRDYASVEKTAMIRIEPSTTSADVAAVARELTELGFTATYVFSTGIREPERVVEVIAGAIGELE